MPTVTRDLSCRGRQQEIFMRRRSIHLLPATMAVIAASAAAIGTAVPAADAHPAPTAREKALATQLKSAKAKIDSSFEGINTESYIFDRTTGL
jgi:hypothetical protein